MANPKLIIPREGRYYITKDPPEPHYHTTLNVWERLNQLSASLAGISSSAEIEYEVPSGTIGGGNDTFTLTKSPSVLLLFVNAVKYVEGTHFTLSGSTITFLAGYIPESGDTIEAYFIE